MVGKEEIRLRKLPVKLAFHMSAFHSLKGILAVSHIVIELLIVFINNSRKRIWRKCMLNSCEVSIWSIFYSLL